MLQVTDISSFTRQRYRWGIMIQLQIRRVTYPYPLGVVVLAENY